MDRASYPQVVNHRVSGFPGGAPGLSDFNFETLSFQEAAQKLFITVVLQEKVLSSSPQAILGTEGGPLFPLPGRSQNRLEAQAT